jgi:hypothetical protein
MGQTHRRYRGYRCKTKGDDVNKEDDAFRRELQDLHMRVNALKDKAYKVGAPRRVRLRLSRAQQALIKLTIKYPPA